MQTLASQSTKVFGGEESNTTSAPATVIFAAFPAATQVKPPLAAIDIDDLVAEFEQSPDSAHAIAQGRQWVAETFYKDQPSSVAQLRLQKGWSQAELARRADTSQPYIARLELGRVDPGVRTVRKIAKALEVPMMTLVQALCPEDEQ
jgi:ribosome-binding protein aMBF1 (putative translation factor)